MLAFTPQNDIDVQQTPNGLRFMVKSSVPEHFNKEEASICRNYLEAEGVFRLPLRIDMTVMLDASRFYVMLGHGRISFATSGSNRRIEDIAEPHYKPVVYADHFPLNTPTDVSIIYNMKSMQILINGDQRYYSVKEKYMKSAVFPELNVAGFRLRLSAHKRTGVLLQNLRITESESEIEIIKKETIPAPGWSKIVKPTFDSVIDGLPKDIHTKIVETDNFLRSFKPIKFKRTIDKNGGKITYLASDAGVSYMIMPHRGVMRHTFGSYLLWNSKDSLGEYNAGPLSAAFNKLAAGDADFTNRILSYKTDCIGCGQNCICRVTYSVQGKSYSACHGKIEFKMVLSEFDDVMRLIKVMGDNVD